MKMIHKLNSKINWTLCLALSLIITSCDLEIEETDSLITEGDSDVFNGVEDTDGSVTTLFNDINGQLATQENLYALSEVTTDELMVPTRGTDWGDNGLWRTLHSHTWSSTHPHILNVWNDKNSAVLRATQLIDPLSNASTEEIALGKFARAYNMWVIMDFYGQVPFRNASDGPEVLPEVFTRAEAYDFVVADLEDAIADLPAGNPSAANKTRAVKATARWLLAKVKLNAAIYKGTGSHDNGDMQDVIDLVDAIEGEGYSLEPNYFDLFIGPEFTNNDVIWHGNADVGTKMWSGLHYNQATPDNAGGGWNGFTTLAEFYDTFEGPNTLNDPTDNENAIGNGQEERRGFTHTLASTNEDNLGFGYGFQIGQMYGWNDGEAVALQDRNNNPLIFTRELPGLIGNNEVTGIRLMKYSAQNGAFNSGTVLARFADAHLMRAEAMLRMGNSGQALTEVNELRALRENTPALGELTEEEMLDERGREFYQEYVRRNDLIRFGAFDDAWQFKEQGDGTTNLFPIPSAALLSNPNLVQNPGY